MVFTVDGTLLGGVGYSVSWADGRLGGDDEIVGLLNDGVGQEVLATPTGPAYTLDLADPHAVLAALQTWTSVTDISGDAPAVPALPPGAVG